MSAPCPVFGFLVELQVAAALTSSQMRELRTAFLTRVIEPRGLTYNERSGGHDWSFVVQSEAGQATDADRQAVQAWAREQREVAATKVGPLLDFASAA
ncbi:MAG: 50S ribosome-binding protein YggL [Deltaproteobacteria bacterium]